MDVGILQFHMYIINFDSKFESKAVKASFFNLLPIECLLPRRA